MSNTLEQCKLVYSAMLEESERVDESTFVWEGSLTALLEKNGMSRSKYSQITVPLKEMGCISQIRRGAGSTSSRWLVHAIEPTEGAYSAINTRTKGRNSTTQRTADLNARIVELERTVAFLMRDYMERAHDKVESDEEVDEVVGA